MLPYGLSDFRRIKLENYYYVDKTHFIPKIEEQPAFLSLFDPEDLVKASF